MAQKISRKFLILIFVLFCIVFYLFWGPLFPWNPIKIGFTEIPATKATIYATELTKKDSVLYHLDEIIQQEEDFHGIEYSDHIKIVVLSQESNNRRYLPWLGGSGYSVSLSPLDVIYIGANARKYPEGIGPHLRHELSHLLIDQNTSFENAGKMQKQAWFVEGIAEFMSGHGFYNKNDLRRILKSRSAPRPSLEGKIPQDMTWQELQLNYSYYKCFIEYLVDSRGIPKLREYLKLYIEDPDNFTNSFFKIYSVDLDTSLKLFNSELSVGE